MCRDFAPLEAGQGCVARKLVSDFPPTFWRLFWRAARRDRRSRRTATLLAQPKSAVSKTDDPGQLRSERSNPSPSARKPSPRPRAGLRLACWPGGRRPSGRPRQASRTPPLGMTSTGLVRPTPLVLCMGQARGVPPGRTRSVRVQSTSLAPGFSVAIEPLSRMADARRVSTTGKTNGLLAYVNGDPAIEALVLAATRAEALAAASASRSGDSAILSDTPS
jgi:hypothetical protein